MSDSNQPTDPRDVFGYIDLFEKVMDRSDKEIEAVRRSYKWLLGSLATIISVGLIVFGFTAYKDRRDMKTDAQTEIELIRRQALQEVQLQVRELNADFAAKVLHAEREVDRRIGEEFDRDKVRALVETQAQARIDAIADALIAKQIAQSINPKIESAAGKLKDLDAELEDYRRRHHIVELANKAIVDADRASYNELRRLQELASEGSSARLFAEAESSRVMGFWAFFERSIDPKAPATAGAPEAFDSKDSGHLENLLKTEKKWQVRRQIVRALGAKQDMVAARALIQIIENDPDLEVSKEALISFQQLTGIDFPNPFGFDYAVKWWKEHHKELDNTFHSEPK